MHFRNNYYKHNSNQYNEIKNNNNNGKLFNCFVNY